ncbi:hypothetical protein [Enterobacter asburiae]|uniref:Phage-like protein n=1 Tax=Enterobacter asburiae TaxID=61645 RepID=A0AAQ0EQ04_ENTAS|nr:hypothetical protein [Enterobacter asburiae]QYD25750.1 hypothetical protein KZX48_17160 [Enterobacter asburiae]
MSELAIIEIAPDLAPSIYVENGLDKFLEQIREGVNEVPDLSTAKGRARIASLAAQVSRSKTAVEKPGRDYLKRLKEQPKVVEAELRRFVTECDQLRDEVRRPLTEWEDAEKARTEALQQRLVDLRALADVIDTAGNYLPSDDIQARIMEAKSVVLDDSWQERAAEAGVAKDSTIQQLESSLAVAQKREHEAAELERLRKEAEEKARLGREEAIRREAAEKATRDAEEKANRERQQHQDALSEISGIQQQVIIAQSGRLGVRQGGTVQCIKETLAETEAWTIDERFGSLIGAAENAKQQAIVQIKQLLVNAETIQKQQEENDRILRETEAKEKNRLAEQKRIADEEARRAADKEHRRTINRQAIADLIESGLSQEMAEKALIAIASGKVSAVSIKY